MHPEAAVDGDVGERLLRHLRHVTGIPRLEYREGLEEIAVSMEASIFRFSLQHASGQWSRPLVLRLYRPDADATDVRIEHAAQNAVAAQGFPAPRVLMSEGGGAALGQPFLIMEHVATTAPTGSALSMAGLRAALVRFLPRHDRHDDVMRLLAQLHSLDGRILARAYMEHGVPAERLRLSARRDLALRKMAELKLEALEPILDWIHAHQPTPPGESICHGDPHFGNVLFRHGRVAAMIDWSSVCLNCPESDLAAWCGPTIAMCYPPASEELQWLVADLRRYDRHRRFSRERLGFYQVKYLWTLLIDIADRAQRRAAGELPTPIPCLDDPQTPDRVAAWFDFLTRGGSILS